MPPHLAAAGQKWPNSRLRQERELGMVGSWEGTSKFAIRGQFLEHVPSHGPSGIRMRSAVGIDGGWNSDLVQGMSAPDLTLHPPRSPRVRLGGYVLLPRMLDKCRAEIAGAIGEYKYNCPLDQRFFQFTGVDPVELKARAAEGLGDGAILAWIESNSAQRREPWEIAQWSAFREQAVPSDNESREFVSAQVAKAGGLAREDVGTWFEFLDLDDHVTFGGLA